MSAFIARTADAIELSIIDSDNFCAAHYYQSSFAPTALQAAGEAMETGASFLSSLFPFASNIYANVRNVNIDVIGVLRCSLFLSVSLFLCTAILLQGTLLELGMVRCRRKLERWNRILTNISRRVA